MRYTLEQLKAMGDKKLYATWLDGHFPFDHASGCNHCLTQHAFHGSGCMESSEVYCEHEAVVVQVRGVDERLAGCWWYPMKIDVLRGNLEQLYALRLFFDSIYPQSTEPRLLAEHALGTLQHVSAK